MKTVRTLRKGDPSYPTRLEKCSRSPEQLYTIGNIEANRGHFVGVVGTRQATERGREQTARFVKELAALVPDLTIVSGLAYGIDIAAHKAALEVGIPTIIVPAHGLDRIYPHVHRPVAVASLENGGLITEYPDGTEPDGWRFIERNRIIAGLSDCVVVVESKSRGGSLTTARFAREYGRKVFAFPGRANDEQSAGCNRLIRDGKARLISSARELAADMGWETQNEPVVQAALFQEVPAEYKPYHDILKGHEDGMHINDLVSEIGQPYSQVSAALMMMEMENLVTSLPGGVFIAK